MSKLTITRTIGNKTLKLETGLLAKQADGAVLVTYGETVILATVVSSDPRPGTSRIVAATNKEAFWTTLSRRRVP